jgi:uncharacterized protein YcbK (DUF882 family)
MIDRLANPCVNSGIYRAWMLCWAVLLGSGLTAIGAGAQSETEISTRFFFSGDGDIHLVSAKNGHSFNGRYRRDGETYDPYAVAAICRVFDAPDPSLLSLRLVEFLDYLQDRLGPGARITITSGYRPTAYNRRLRKQGGLAAKASLHQYGMAADLKMAGVSARRIWETVKALGFGGTGYYHGETVHIDVGPARSWDEKTSGVNTGISDDNKLIGLVADYDKYRPGERVTLRFIRMTAFPIAVAAGFVLESPDPSLPVAVFQPVFSRGSQAPCPRFDTIEQMASIRWRLPADLPPGRYRIRAGFCQNPWDEMPAEVSTPVFDVMTP